MQIFYAVEFAPVMECRQQVKIASREIGLENEGVAQISSGSEPLKNFEKHHAGIRFVLCSQKLNEC